MPPHHSEVGSECTKCTTVMVVMQGSYLDGGIKETVKKVWGTKQESGQRNWELRMWIEEGDGSCNQPFGTGQKEIAGRTAENVYQCPLQLCLQLLQLSGDSG